MTGSELLELDDVFPSLPAAAPEVQSMRSSYNIRSFGALILPEKTQPSNLLHSLVLEEELSPPAELAAEPPKRSPPRRLLLELEDDDEDDPLDCLGKSAALRGDGTGAATALDTRKATSPQNMDVERMVSFVWAEGLERARARVTTRRGCRSCGRILLI